MKWLRYCRLVVATDNTNTEAIDLSDFRIKFKISQATTSKPCTADITVYNISRETIDAISFPTNQEVSSRRLRVILEAGYVNGEKGIIFSGNLWWKSVGRESETDTFMRLIAGSGDRTKFSIVNTSLPKGATQAQALSTVSDSMKDSGGEIKRIPPLIDGNLPRGKVLYGSSPDVLQSIADTNGFDWGYNNEGIVAVEKKVGFDRKNEAIVVNVETGMIGRPQITPDGLIVLSLLDPRFEVGTIIHVDNKSVTGFSFDTSYTAVNQFTASNEMLSADGYYVILSREHEGDNRGNEWYTKLVCEGLHASTQPFTPNVLNIMPN